MESNLISRLKTTEDRDLLLSELDLLLKSIYEGSGGSFDITLKNKVRSWVAAIILSEIESVENLDKKSYLENLKNEVQKIEDMKLGLAYEPSESALERIHDRIVKYSRKQILIDLTTNKNIVGGAVIVYKGKYRDFSMKKVFETEMQNAREEINEILNSKKA